MAVAVWKPCYPNGVNALQLAEINEKSVVEANSHFVIAPTSAGKTRSGCP